MLTLKLNLKVGLTVLTAMLRDIIVMVYGLTSAFWEEQRVMSLGKCLANYTESPFSWTLTYNNYRITTKAFIHSTF